MGDGASIAYSTKDPSRIQGIFGMDEKIGYFGKIGDVRTLLNDDGLKRF